MTNKPKYLTLPLAAYSGFFTDLEKAKQDAREVCAKFGEDMVILKVEFVGHYENVKPIYFEDDPSDRSKPIDITSGPGNLT